MFNFGIMGGVFGNVMSIFGASDKIVMLMQHTPTVNATGGSRPQPQAESRIDLKEVEFNYPSKKEVQVLKGVSI